MNTQVDSGRVSRPEIAGVGGSVTGRRRSVGVMALIALVACCGALFYVWRVWWDQAHPMQAAARGLRSGNATRRAEAARDVANLGMGRGGEPIRLVIPALKDEDPGVRAAAAESLGMLGSNAAHMGLDPGEVRAATAALGERIKDPNAGVRVATTNALGLIATAVASRPGGGAGPGAAGTAEASDVDAKALADELVSALGDGDTAVREAALTGLGALASTAPGGPPPALIKALDDESTANRSAATRALVAHRRALDPAIPALLRHLEDADPRVREACAAALGGIRPPAVTPAVAPAVIAGLRLPDRAAREGLATLVGRLKPDPDAAVPALIVVLREPIDSDVKVTVQGGGPYENYSGPAYAAAHALGEVAPGTPRAGEAIAALTEVVRSGPPPRRGPAAEALGAFGPAAAPAVPALIGLLKETGSSKAPTRAGGAAAGALGRIAPGTSAADEALAALVAALRDPWIPTREAALAALPAFGPKAAAALPAVRELKDKDPDRGVRRTAGAALGKIKP